MLHYSDYFKIDSNVVHCVMDLGKVYLPSGNIYCCDPFLSDEVNALEKTVPTGYFDIKLSLVTFPDWGKRIILAGLILSEHNPVTWQKAIYIINDECFSEFRVDAGLACFMDQETRELFIRVVDDFYKNNPEGN